MWTYSVLCNYVLNFISVRIGGLMKSLSYIYVYIYTHVRIAN